MNRTSTAAARRRLVCRRMELVVVSMSQQVSEVRGTAKFAPKSKKKEVKNIGLAIMMIYEDKMQQYQTHTSWHLCKLQIYVRPSIPRVWSSVPKHPGNLSFSLQKPKIIGFIEVPIPTYLVSRVYSSTSCLRCLFHSMSISF